MTDYDKSTIQRMLGKIEGVAMVLDDTHATPLLDAVRVIDEILMKKGNALMTASEARTYLEDLQRGLTRNRNDYPQEIIEANGAAILALEKQIPKKPVIKTHKYIGSDDDFVNKYHCPVCKALIINEDTNGFYAGRKQKYCDCGQVLDWSDTE